MVEIGQNLCYISITYRVIEKKYKKYLLFFSQFKKLAISLHREKRVKRKGPDLLEELKQKNKRLNH